MKVVAGLAWYDEQPSFLAATIASLKGVVDHVVAVDGSYYLYPRGRRSSGAEQHRVIVEATYGAGLGLSLHVPSDRWLGNELEKRNYLLDACKLVCDDERDWIFCLDADEVVTTAPAGFREQLERAEEDVAGVTFWNRHPVENVSEMARQFWWRREDRLLRHRVMWRALSDLRVVGAHYCYLAGGDRLLRGAYGQSGEEPCVDLWDFEVEHRHDYRDLDRNQSALKYAELRDTSGAERPVGT